MGADGSTAGKHLPETSLRAGRSILHQTPETFWKLEPVLLIFVKTSWFKNAVAYCVDVNTFATETEMASEILLACDKG
jgi:hypothetical protein